MLATTKFSLLLHWGVELDLSVLPYAVGRHCSPQKVFQQSKCCMCERPHYTVLYWDVVQWLRRWLTDYTVQTGSNPGRAESFLSLTFDLLINFTSSTVQSSQALALQANAMPSVSALCCCSLLGVLCIAPLLLHGQLTGPAAVPYVSLGSCTLRLQYYSPSRLACLSCPTNHNTAEDGIIIILCFTVYAMHVLTIRWE